MTKIYFIGKDKYVHKITDWGADGAPRSSTREDKKAVSCDVYTNAFLSYLGFSDEDIAKVDQVSPYTKQVAQARYLALYENKNVELDPEVVLKSTREVGRVQEKLYKAI